MDRAVGRRAWVRGGVGGAAPERREPRDSTRGGPGPPPSLPRRLSRAADVLPTFSLPRAGLRSRGSRRPLPGPGGHRLRLSVFCRGGTCSRSGTGTGARSRARSCSSRRHGCHFAGSRENSLCSASRRLARLLKAGTTFRRSHRWLCESRALSSPL